MKQTTRRSIVSFMSFIFVFLPILLIPVLVQSRIISLPFGIIAAIPFSLLFVFVILSLNGGSNGRIIRRNIFFIGSGLSYLFIGSVVYILSAKNSLSKLFFIIPIDVVIFAIPVYLIYRINRPATLNREDCSADLSERLHSLVNEPDANEHSVYITKSKINRSFTQTSNGPDWQVLINEDSLTRLNSQQIDAVLLEAYYSRRTGMTKLLLLYGATYVAVAIDLLLLGSILTMLVPAAYVLYPLLIAIIGWALILAMPITISYLLRKLQFSVDSEVIARIPDTESFISAIEKKKSLMNPLRPMSLKQQIRYDTRIGKAFQKRIDRIRKLNTNAGKQ